MKRFVLLLFLFTLIGCANNTDNRLIIDPAFESIYGEFLADAGIQGFSVNSNSPIVLRFATLEQQDALGEVIGECSSVGYANPGSIVSIDSNYWNNATIIQQKVLLYHELGHCLLSRIHTLNILSIMNALLNNPLDSLQANLITWNAMVYELFLNHGN